MFLLELKFEREKQIRLLIEQDSENKLKQRKYLSVVCYKGVTFLVVCVMFVCFGCG